MLTITDSYGNIVTCPENTGPSTWNEGQLFAAIEGTVLVKSARGAGLDGETLGRFSVVSDGTVLFKTPRYNQALQFCAESGLTPVDCTR